jgi:Aspartyl protease
MKSLRHLFAILLLIVALSTARAQPAGLPPFAHAKLSVCDGLPCIDAQIGDKHLRLGIDSGDPDSVLSLQAAQTLGLTLKSVIGDDGKPMERIQQVTVPGVVIGDLTFKDMTFLVFNLSKAISDGTFPHVDGTIAYGAFKDRILQLDYPGGLFNLSQPLTTPTVCPANCGDISLITFGKHGPPIVTTTGFTINGKPIAVQIDTMFVGDLLIYPTSVDKLGLTTESQSKTSQYIPFTDGGVDMFQSEVHQLGFGPRVLATKAPLYFAGPKVHLPDGLFDGTVGSTLLSPHKVTFNFHDNKFWLD